MITPIVKTTPQVVITVVDTINKFGIPASIKGYEYLKSALCLTLENPSILQGITKELYPEIAKEHGTTKSRVERAIRHAVETAFYRMDQESIQQYFGGCIHPNKGKPTNGEFIAIIAERIRIQIGAYDKEVS